MTATKKVPTFSLLDNDASHGFIDHEMLVRVAWWDATHLEDGEPLEATTEVGVVRYTVGYAVRDDDMGMVVAADLCDGVYTKGYTIPRPYVLDVAYLSKHD